jgi:hypothetical protein
MNFYSITLSVVVDGKTYSTESSFGTHTCFNLETHEFYDVSGDEFDDEDGYIQFVPTEECRENREQMRQEEMASDQ